MVGKQATKVVNKVFQLKGKTFTSDVSDQLLLEALA